MIPVYNIYIVKTMLCKHKLHILEILACGTKRRLKNGSASLCHYQRNEFYIFEFVAACGPRQTHFHTEAQTDSRDWRNPLRQNLTVLPDSPFCRCATSVPLFVTCGDISPRRGENLSRPGEVFLMEGGFGNTAKFSFSPDAPSPRELSSVCETEGVTDPPRCRPRQERWAPRPARRGQCCG